MSENQDYSPTGTPAATPERSSLALISLIAGIATWVLLPVIGAIVAVITGHRARREIRDSMEQLTGNGMATVGLVLGYLQLALAVLSMCVIVTLILLGPAIGNVFSDIVTNLQ